MGEFERELVKRRQEITQREREQRLAVLQEERRRQEEFEISVRRYNEELESKYSSIIEQLSPMVVDILNGLGNQTWGRGRYKIYTSRAWIGFIGGEPPVYKYDLNTSADEIELAEWTIGKAERKRWLCGDKKISMYYFQVGLYSPREALTYFRVPKRYQHDDRTMSTERGGLRELMMEEFFAGPLLVNSRCEHDRDYPPGG